MRKFYLTIIACFVISLPLRAQLFGGLIKTKNTLPASCGATNVHNASLSYGSVTDQDGNLYKTIQIGSQVWMAENLKVGHYQNGDAIPVVTDSTLWASLSTGATCWNQNDSATYNCPYGRLYNWFAAVDTRKVCPLGWHMPSHAEWNILTKYLDPSADTTVNVQGTYIGDILKNTGTLYWLSSPSVTVATNSSGFSALPGGWRSAWNGFFLISGDNGRWWTKTPPGVNYPTPYASSRELHYSGSVIIRNVHDATFGYSVRCVEGIDIGQYYQGGIIGYILQPGDPGYDANVPHGLIAAPSDQSIGIQWYNGSFVTTGATATALGIGNANTNTIVSIQGAGSYAAKLCYDLVLNGYSDWFLPSKDELNKLYLNQTAIGGFAATYYWSSSEVGNNDAWLQGFGIGNGGQFANVKYGPGLVRAVRAF